MKRNGYLYFPILEKEIKERGIKKKAMEKLLDIDHVSFWYKLNGKRPFTIDQALLIWKTWFSDVPVQELFWHE